MWKAHTLYDGELLSMIIHHLHLNETLLHLAEIDLLLIVKQR